jgi:hypothetical protein
MVLDDGNPLSRTFVSRDKGIWYSPYSCSPVSIFPTRNVATSVRRWMRDRYIGCAGVLSPDASAQQKSDHARWLKRARAVRVRAVLIDEPTAKELRR